MSDSTRNGISRLRNDLIIAIPVGRVVGQVDFGPFAF